MNPKLIVFTLVTFTHNLFTAIWIGGLISIGLASMPAVKEVLGRGPQTKKLMNTVQERQRWLVYISIAGLILTGLLMAQRAPAFEGLFAFSNLYTSLLTIKHILILIMIAIALWRSLVFGSRQKSANPSQEKWSARLLLTNIVLGVTVLLTSAVLTALASNLAGRLSR
jgi:putative copper resistance protein D